MSMSYIRYYLYSLALIQINPSELQLHHLLNGKKYSLSQINQQDKTVENASDLHLERNPCVWSSSSLSLPTPLSDLHSNFMACLDCINFFPKLHLASGWLGRAGLALRVYTQSLDVGGIGWSQESRDVFGSLSLFPSTSLGPFLHLFSSLWTMERSWAEVAPVLSLTTGCPVTWSSILSLASWEGKGPGQIWKTLPQNWCCKSTRRPCSQPSRQDFPKNKDLIHNNSLTTLWFFSLNIVNAGDRNAGFPHEESHKSFLFSIFSIFPVRPHLQPNIPHHYRERNWNCFCLDKREPCMWGREKVCRMLWPTILPWCLSSLSLMPENGWAPGAWQHIFALGRMRLDLQTSAKEAPHPAPRPTWLFVRWLWAA